MARFRATIKGQRGQASRLGSPKSGITANVNGWDVGIRVVGSVDNLGIDVYDVYLTGGSHAAHSPVHLGRFDASDIKAAQPIKAV